MRECRPGGLSFLATGWVIQRKVTKRNGFRMMKTREKSGPWFYAAMIMLFSKVRGESTMPVLVPNFVKNIPTEMSEVRISSSLMVSFGLRPFPNRPRICIQLPWSANIIHLRPKRWNLNARLSVLVYLTPASPENSSVILRGADESADTGFVLTPPPDRSHNPGVAYHRRYS